MGTLDGVGHGTALGGRYRLEERLQAGPGFAYWRAVDQTLERPVGVRVVRGRTAEDTLDAARRAAMVEDSRLLRVLDVGIEGASEPVTFVVAEFVEAQSLAALLHATGPLPAEDVRTMVGEAAQALEHARLAGLHHRRLTPASLLRAHDGTVKVAGLAVDAAAAGIEDEDDVSAARQDAVALVALIYAGLTGRWPLDGGDGLEPAPRLSGEPAPPTDLVSGVPNDLDTLCAVTFGPHHDGPNTPGELAGQLAPWGLARAERPAAATPSPRAAEPAAGSGMRPAGRFPVRLGGLPPTSAASGDDTPGESRRNAAEDRGAASPAATRELPAIRPAQLPPSDPPAAHQPPARAVAAPRPTAPVAPPARPAPSAERFSFAEAIGTREALASPAPARNTTKIILAAVAGVVVIGLVLAINSLANIGGDDDADRATRGASSPTASAPASGAGGAAAPTTNGSAAGAPTIAGVSTLDPQGADGENDESAPRAIDADPASFWNSSTYKTADFGGLKDGVGMVVQLAQPSTVSVATLSINGTGGTVELRTAPGPGLGGSQVVGTADVTAGQVEFELDPAVETEFLVIWFTQLPQTAEGFRIELAQVQVK